MVTNTLDSPHITELLDRLFQEADASEEVLQAVAQSDASHLLTSRTGYRQLYALLKNIPLPVSRETGYLLYMLARSTNARHIVEFGTSFGVTTIFLAAALRDNGAGRVITTEFVDIREGDALETLAHDLPVAVDLVLLDGAKGLYTDILRLLEGHLHPRSLVLADDARHCQEFVTRMRSDAKRYLSVPLAGDLEISMRIS